MKIRQAELQDLEILTKIYNYEVENGTATFDMTPKSVEERKEWFNAHNHDAHPLIVAVGDDSLVTGYASLSSYGAKDAFKTTAELSIYVHQNHRGKGIGRALAQEILARASKEGKLHLIISVITSGNEASCALHRTLGFEYQGSIPEIAQKFGKYLGVDFYTLKI